MSPNGQVLNRSDLLRMISNWGYRKIKIFCRGTTVYLLVAEKGDGAIDSLIERNQNIKIPPTKESYFEDFAKSVNQVTPDWVDFYVKLYNSIPDNGPYR